MRLTFKKIKIFSINILVLFISIVIIECFFGYWFKNELSERLSSERNIERIYKFNFSNHKGTSFYKRNNQGFRVSEKELNDSIPEIIFVGGSTTNQKFLNYEDTIVGRLQENFKKIKIVNAGVDGMSILGHINSFQLWFDKIDNFNPKYYIFYIGINDQANLKKNDKINSIDNLIESSSKNNFIEYVESNSFFYSQIRRVKTILFIKTGNDLFSNNVNDGEVVYGERTTKDFKYYSSFESNDQQTTLNEYYNSLLIDLTSKVKERNSEIIYITQISGTGMNKNLYVIANTIISHCRNYKLNCINLAKNANLNYEDFYDWTHLNPKGSKKVSNFLTKEFQKLSIN